MPVMPPRLRSFLQFAAPCSLITAAVCSADAPIFSNACVYWDDHVTLYRNPDFNPPTAATLVTCWTQPHGRLYVPVTYTFWWTLAEMSWTPAGLDPAVFHATSM